MILIEDASTTASGKQRAIKPLLDRPMTELQARAIVNARNNFERARKELNQIKLSETRYRGNLYTTDARIPQNVHGTFTYRGQTYEK